MTDCCPTCGRPIAARFHTPFREKLIRLADGTRTDKELARLTGSTPGSVRVALTSLRQQGVPVKSTPVGGNRKRKVMPREEYEHLAMLRGQGLGWEVIARLVQQPSASIRNRYYRAEKEYGSTAPYLMKKKETRLETMFGCAN